VIKLKDILKKIIKEFSGADSAGNSDNGGIWAPPGKVRKLPDGMIKGWAQVDMGPKADNPFSDNTEWREDTHEVTIPGGYYNALETDDFITTGVGKKGENFIQNDAKMQDIEAKGRNIVKEANMKLKDILKEVDFDLENHPKKKWIKQKLSSIDPDIMDYLFNEYVSVYSDEGLDLSAYSASELKNSYEVVMLIDIDKDPLPDAFIFVRGDRLKLLATDGESASKSEVIKKVVNMVKSEGYTLEASKKMESIMKSKGAPFIDDEKKIKKMVGPKFVEWIGDGYYKRKLKKGGVIVKRMYGK